MIHKIKSLYDNGKGMSVRKIAKELGVSRNTVSKYLKMPEAVIADELSTTDRSKKLDDYRSYIIHLLQTYPGLSAVKILRKLKAKVDLLEVSERSVRRYIQTLKNEINFKQARYYEPVVDMIPGVQCQVDGGELRGVMIGGVETTVYFMVFVLSFSRLMYVSLSDKPIDTQTLIYQHDAAFRYFEGVPQECVYDQTKLVVISETFRELTLNQRFHQYATAAGFHIRACEGYDPESKGKVEAGVKYVKQNALYGESFIDWKHLESYMSEWLANIANQRLHGTTGQQPGNLYELMEKTKMQAYLTPVGIANNQDNRETRQVDKTGLISWQSNKYSVPLAYQSSTVAVASQDGLLSVFDMSTAEKIAEHPLSLEKNQIIKNTHHYRDLNQRITAMEAEVSQLLGATEGSALCDLLKLSSPKIYKDQLLAVIKILATHLSQFGILEPELLTRLLAGQKLTATMLRDRLAVYQQQRYESPDVVTQERESLDNSLLAQYGNLNVRSIGQGESHVIH